jgi:hypothetical protein
MPWPGQPFGGPTVTLATAKRIRIALAAISTDVDLVDIVDKSRPPYPHCPISPTDRIKKEKLGRFRSINR